MKLMAALSDEQMKRDAKILTSMKGIGGKTALNFLIETEKARRRGGARSDHVRVQASTRDRAKSARGGTVTFEGLSGS
jgi:hypothetical protein